MKRLTILAAAAMAATFAAADEISELNEKWGKEGRLSFEKGQTGYPVAVLACKDGTAKVSLLGGNVFSYVPAGQKEVLYTPSKMPFVLNGKDFVHGGIPVCWPWFNCFDFPGRPLHGFARSSLWEVKKVAVTDDFAEITLMLKTTEETKKLWPYDARAELMVRVSSYLDVVLKTINTGKAEFALTEGLHAYFYVEDEAQAILKGFKNCYWDSLSPNCKMVRFGEDEIKCTPGEGRVWGWAPFTTTLVDPLMKRKIDVSSYGKKRLILWSCGKPAEGTEPGENMDADTYKHFFCIEPSTIPREDAWIIPPGRCHELQLSVKSTPEN